MRRVLVALAVGLMLAGCSLPTDDEAAIIDPEDLPDVLRSDREIEAEETEPPGPQTVTVEIFLLDAAGERTIVVQRDREVSPQSGFSDRIELLFGEEVRTEEEQESFSNALREFTLLEASVNDNDIAVIDMVALDDDGAPIEIEGGVLRNAAAQLVYTATGFPDVVAVRIRIDGSNVLLPTSEGDTDEVVDRDDYFLYDAAFEVTTTTAEPTTTTTEAPAEEGDGG